MTVLTNVNVVTIVGQEFSLTSVYDITERRKNEGELQHHRDHLETLVDERTVELEAAR